MNTLEITNRIMRSNKLFAKKCFGQNFLVDDSILSGIVDSSNVEKDDLVIEIGPGLGNLTEYILQTGAQVLAFEIDTDMIEILKGRFAAHNNLTIVNTDILKVDLEEYIKVTKGKVRVIANLPYYITTPIIFKLLEYKESIASITVMVQKEVADRIASKPGSKEFGVLTINTNYQADVEKIFVVPNTSFVPAPNVTSAVIKITPNKEKEQALGIKDGKIFEELVKKAFSERRKKMANSLANCGLCGLTKGEIEEIIKKVGLKETVRAEEVAVETFAKIANEIYELKNK